MERIQITPTKYEYRYVWFRSMSPQKIGSIGRDLNFFFLPRKKNMLPSPKIRVGGQEICMGTFFAESYTSNTEKVHFMAGGV